MAAAPARRSAFLRRSLAGCAGDIVLVAGLSMIVNVLMLVPAIYMLQVYDRVLTSFSELTLLAVSLITLGLFAAMAVAEWQRGRTLVRAGVRFDRQVGPQVFRAGLAAQQRQPGPGAARAFQDLLQLRQFFTGPGMFALMDAPWAPVYIAVTFLLHPRLGWLALGFVLVQALLAWFGHRRAVPPAEAAGRAGTEVHAYLHSKLRNAEVIEALGMAGQLRRRFREAQARFLSRSSRAHAASINVGAVSKFVRYSQQSLALGAGALLVIEGELSPGAMIAANLLIARALAPIEQLVGVWRGFAASRMAYGRLDELLEAHPPAAGGQADPLVRAHLVVRGLRARAPGRSAPILKDVSIELPPGSLTALVGPSGSGKSTLARAVLGLWPDTEGEVLLQGRPLADWDRAALGPCVGYLPQAIGLLSGSLAENIARFGEVDSAKVIEAARLTGLHEAILRLPKGYDTPVGEAGELLSAGQRQRVALARAVYGAPAFLVLDEPNAHLDEAGELALHRALERLRGAGCTVLVATHRPGVIALADRLVVLNDGEVLAQGPRQAVIDELRLTPPDASGASDGLSLQPA